MALGTLYGVGVGPGDPELLTLKALRILREADVVAVPDKGDGEGTAMNIVKDYIQGKNVLRCVTPMVRDKERLAEAYDRIAEDLCAQLAQGRTVAFITLGDPTVYSTYVYVHQRVLERGFEAVLVPGVPSFCAVAARLNMSLCEHSERLLIVPASHRDVEDCLKVDANLVFMKAGREIGALRDKLAAHGLLERASMVSRCGMEGEEVFPRFGDMEREAGYFSVVVVKRGG